MALVQWWEDISDIIETTHIVEWFTAGHYSTRCIDPGGVTEHNYFR